MTLDLDFFAEHFDPYHPTYPAQILDAVPELHRSCPVAKSDQWGGYWVTWTYQNMVDVFENWEAFSSVEKKSITPVRDTTPVRPPIAIDPPEQRGYRQLLNPYFTPKRIAEFEPGIRALTDELIDGFIERGECDLVSEFSREFPGRMLYRFLLNVDAHEAAKAHRWTRNLALAPTDPATRESEAEWVAWVYDLIRTRRAGERRDDVIDGLLHNEVNGKLLDDKEIMGVLMILILGGFATTADAISNAMYRLGCDPALRDRLRADRGAIRSAIDELLRYDPPVSVLARLCVKDTEVDGRLVKAGERIAVSFIGANRDASEFADPAVLDIDREQNRHLTFGIGVHRCIGSNVARLNLRVSLEQLLDRIGDFRFADGYRDASRDAAMTWGLNRLPLVFTPGPRLGG